MKVSYKEQRGMIHWEIVLLKLCLKSSVREEVHVSM